MFLFINLWDPLKSPFSNYDYIMDNKISLPPISDILNSSSMTYPQPMFPSHSQLPPYTLAPYSAPLRQSPPNSTQPYKPTSLPIPASNYYYQSVPAVYQVNSSNPSPPSSRSSTASATNSPERSLAKSPVVYSEPSQKASPTTSATEKRRSRNNLPKETTYVLLKWLNEHLNHPYPNTFEKNHLMMATGLNQQQLSNWFINARRRKIKTLKEQQNLN